VQGAGRDRAGEGLAVDVPQVWQGEAVRVQLLVQAREPDPRLHRCQTALAVNVHNLVIGIERDETSVGEGDARE
jgi:hypothetical protein